MLWVVNQYHDLYPPHNYHDHTPAPPPPPTPTSGGTAFNSVARQLHNKTQHVTYVLPISDNGGSTREIVRVVGGPAIGDIRSRLIRLSGDRSKGGRAVTKLLEHRLNGESTRAAQAEFLQVKGNDCLLDMLQLLSPVSVAASNTPFEIRTPDPKSWHRSESGVDRRGTARALGRCAGAIQADGPGLPRPLLYRNAAAGIRWRVQPPSQ